MGANIKENNVGRKWKDEEEKMHQQDGGWEDKLREGPKVGDKHKGRQSKEQETQGKWAK